jgi:hypothetical protein
MKERAEGLASATLDSRHPTKIAAHSRSFNLLSPSALLASPWNGVMRASLTMLSVLLELANVAAIGSRASLSCRRLLEAFLLSFMSWERWLLSVYRPGKVDKFHFLAVEFLFDEVERPTSKVTTDGYR